MDFHRRRLPHLHALNQPVFLTWRLHGSLPPERNITAPNTPSEKSFALMDRLLDSAKIGPLHLRKSEIADLVHETLAHSAESLKHQTIHAYVIMPNHVHLLTTPHIPLPQLTKSIKTFTARLANRLLQQTGKPFWQQETYDKMVRDQHAFDQIKTYIHQNPVKAGLARSPETYKYSTAHPSNVKIDLRSVGWPVR